MAQSVTCPTAADGGSLQIGCPALPNTTGLPATNTNQDGMGGPWELFAWNSFIAMNWPALAPTSSNGYNRGFPDTSKTFANAGADDLLVWETLKEKREVFYHQYRDAAVNAQPAPSPWNSAVHYGEPVPANISDNTPPNPLDIPYCPGVTPPANIKQLFQSGKLFVDDLDETLEVSSEALEGDALLCPADNPNCGVEGNAVGPRVWMGKPSDPNPNPVLYEVKVNYDFFDYVTTNQLYADTVKSTYISPAVSGPRVNRITLPFRTDAANVANAQQEPPGSQSRDGGMAPSYANPTNGYSASTCLSTYQGAQGSSTAMLPCPQGSVHLKAAWIRLDNPSQATLDSYHTAESLYYKTVNGAACMDYATFGLVGLHIIQRLHVVDDSGNPNDIGGTFIFATWEHTGLDIPVRTDPTVIDPSATSGFSYTNYLGRAKPDQANPPAPGFYPPISTNPANDHALPVTRRFDLTQSTQNANTTVWNAISAINPDSVWLNYQLIGVQFTSDEALSNNTQPVTDPCVVGDNPNDPSCKGQQFYLANALIETNEGLQFFQGLPPLSGSNTSDDYVRAAGSGNIGKNLHHGGSDYNMGGCMGCHGVARLKGTAFSFVLLLGQAGAGVDTQGEFEIPADPFGQLEDPQRQTVYGVSNPNAGNNLETFAVSAGGTLYHDYYSNAWNTWNATDNALTNAPQATSVFGVVNPNASSNLEMFATGRDGTLYHNYYSSGGWASWSSTDNALTNAPKSDSVFGIHNPNAGNNLEMFAIGEDGTLYHNYYSSTWNTWSATDNALTDAPKATTVFAVANPTANNNLEVFAAGGDGTLYHNYYSSGGWASWSSTDNALTDAPESVSIFGAVNPNAGNNLEMYAVSPEGVLYHNYYSNGWANWSSTDNALTSAPEVDPGVD